MLGILLAAVAAIATPSLVPGGCTAPAAEHQNEAGCYLLSEFAIVGAPPELYWHIAEFADAGTANDEAARHRWARVFAAHGRTWLLAMGDKSEAVGGGSAEKVIGPMAVPAGGSASIRFLISNFPPGMRTRVHSHPGAEAFYVVDGVQCVETPADRHRIAAGEAYILPSGIHMQAAPEGRRSLVALVLRPGETWPQPESSWTPTSYCDR